MISDKTMQQLLDDAQELQSNFTTILTKILDFTPAEDNWFDMFSQPTGVASYPLEVGTVAKAELSDGRRMVLVGTPVGCVAVLERPASEAGPFALEVIAPNSVAFMVDAHSPATFEVLERIVDWNNLDRNIGMRLAHLEKVMQVHRRVKTRVQERLEEVEFLPGSGTSIGEDQAFRTHYSESSVVEEHEHRLYAHLTGYNPKNDPRFG
jgi:hypothetical protein